MFSLKIESKLVYFLNKYADTDRPSVYADSNVILVLSVSKVVI